MARLLRGYGVSKIGKPQVVNPPVVFDPVKRTLTYSSLTGRAAHWKLRPPTIVGPPIVFDPLKNHWIPSPKQGRAPHSHLSPPAIVNPPVVFDAVKRYLTKARTPPKTGWRSGVPTVLGVTVVFIPSPPAIYRARVARPPRTRSVSGTPTVIGAQVVAFLPTAPAIFRARTVRPPKTSALLRPPSVVAPAITFGPLRLALAPQPKQGRATHSRLAPPTVTLLFTAAPIRRALVPQPGSQFRRTRPRLAAPTVVGAASTFRGVNAYYTVAVRRAVEVHKIGSKLKPPTVVSTPSGDNPSGGTFDPNYFLIIHP